MLVHVTLIIVPLWIGARGWISLGGRWRRCGMVIVIMAAVLLVGFSTEVVHGYRREGFRFEMLRFGFEDLCDDLASPGKPE